MTLQDQIKGRLNQYEISVEDAKVMLESILGASKILRGHKLSHRRRELFKEFQEHLMNIIRLAQVDLTERQMDRNALIDNEKCMKADEGYKESLLKELKTKTELLDEVQLKSAARWKACNIKDDDISKLKEELVSIRQVHGQVLADKNNAINRLSQQLYTAEKELLEYRKKEAKPGTAKVPNYGCGNTNCPSCYY